MHDKRGHRVRRLGAVAHLFEKRLRRGCSCRRDAKRPLLRQSSSSCLRSSHTAAMRSTEPPPARPTASNRELGLGTYGGTADSCSKASVPPPSAAGSTLPLPHAALCLPQQRHLSDRHLLSIGKAHGDANGCVAVRGDGRGTGDRVSRARRLRSHLGLRCRFRLAYHGKGVFSTVGSSGERE